MGGSCHLCYGAKSLKPDLAWRPGGAFSAFTQLDPRHHKKGLLAALISRFPNVSYLSKGEAFMDRPPGSREEGLEHQGTKRSVGSYAGGHKLYVTGYGSWQAHTCTMFFETKLTPFKNSDFFFLFLTSKFLAFCTSLATPTMLGLGLLHVVALGQRG